MHTIYLLRDPITHQVRYIGCTKRELKVRLNGHCNRTFKPSQPKQAWINELLDAGLRPTIEAIEETDDKLRERYWIEHYRSQGIQLLNVILPGRRDTHFLRRPARAYIRSVDRPDRLTKLEKKPRWKRLISEREQSIHNMKKQGLSYRDISKLMGVSRQRVHQIYNKAQRLIENA